MAYLALYALLALSAPAGVEPSPRPDLGLSARDVLYDTGLGRIEFVVRVKHAAGLLPIRVAVSDGKGGTRKEILLEKVRGSAASCELDWPRAPLGSKIRITVSAQGAVKEPDLSNNTVVVTMEEAIRRDVARFGARLRALKSGKLKKSDGRVFEAEDFPVKKNVRVEKVKGASKGKAVRLLDRKSRIEWDVSLDKGMYMFYVIGMGMAPDQDALRVSLGTAHKRGVLYPSHRWVIQDDSGAANLAKGTYKLAVYYDEPNVLVDKVVVVRYK